MLFLTHAMYDIGDGIFLGSELADRLFRGKLITARSAQHGLISPKEQIYKLTLPR